jgi:N-acyl-D-amino-acid deacylase
MSHSAPGRVVALLLALLCGAGVAPARISPAAALVEVPHATDVDIHIRGGDVFLGDGSPVRAVDVGIKDDSIVLLDRNADVRAKRVIDARGLAVAPGFINMLSWSTESLIVDGRSESELRQGVTTQIFGEGQSMGPLNAAMKRRRKAQQTVAQFEYEWDTLAEYLRWLERRGVAQNVASFVGAGTVREYVLGLSNRAPNASELEQMQRLVESEMRSGALGVGSALVYPPGSYATTDELIALCRVAAQHGGMYISHIRSQSDEFVEAVDELIRISRDAGLPAEVYHLGAAGEPNWPKLEQVIHRIEDARSQGQRITANMHAYPAGCTGLTACLPPWCHEGGDVSMWRRLQDPSVRRRVARDLERPIKGWDNPYRTVGSPERVMPVHFENPRLKEFQGKSLARIAAARGQTPVDTLMDLIVEDRSRIDTVYFVDCEENVQKQIGLPWVSFGSDAASMSTDRVFAGHGTHPRAFGNFARVLGKYVRDEGLIPWEQAIHRMTGLPAANLGLDRRGLISDGYFADIVVFDRETITDRATFAAPQQYAEGVKYVIVNGKLALDDGRPTGSLSGRALFRKSPNERGAADRASEAGAVTPLLDEDAAAAGLANRVPIEPLRSLWPLAARFRAQASQTEESFRREREQLVRDSLEHAEPPIRNKRVLDAMRATPRHQFVAQQYRKFAYIDTVLPIGYQQTISPPYIVAYMTEKIDPQPTDRVLEIGTGSGYQAAVLSPIAQEVYSIEIVEQLGRKAAEVLKRLGYQNVFTKVGDGYKGWPEKAPFDKIIVTCSPDHIPEPLIEQLNDGGLMIIPVGERYQQSFYLVKKSGGKLEKERLLGTFFVPMTGEAERQRRDNPDGTSPTIANGGFEQGTDSEGGPEFWYYQRGVKVEDRDAPEGKHFVQYANDQPGYLAHSNQGFAVDGRRVEYLDLTFSVRTERVRSGPKPEHTPGVLVTFFDRNRSFVSTARGGPYEGTSKWVSKRELLPVPKSAQDAVIMIGLNGGTGQISFDDFQMTPIPRSSK